MSWKSFLHKGTRAHFAVGCILASLQLGQQALQELRYEQVFSRWLPTCTPIPAIPEKTFFQACHIEPVLVPFWEHNRGRARPFKLCSLLQSTSNAAGNISSSTRASKSRFFWILNVCWHFEHEEPNAARVAALHTKLAWDNIKCKSSVKVNKTRNFHVQATAHCFSWMFYIIPFPPGRPVISTFALFCILIRAHSLNCALWWSKTFYSNAIQSKCCYINYSLMELCAVTSSELTHSQSERFTVPFWWKAQRNLTFPQFWSQKPGYWISSCEGNHFYTSSWEHSLNQK